MVWFKVFTDVQYTVYTIYIHFKIDRSINDAIKSKTKFVIFSKIILCRSKNDGCFIQIEDNTQAESGLLCRILSHLSPLRISYCCADALFSHVFAFIAVNKDETMECHAFLCRKRKIVNILPFISETFIFSILGSSCFSDSRSSI